MLHTQHVIRTIVAKKRIESNSLTPNRRWFEHHMRANKISQRGLAVKLGMEPSGLNRRLKGSLRITLDEATRIANLFNVPVDEVLSNAGASVPDVVRPKGKGVPVVGWVDSAFEIHFTKPQGPQFVEAPPVPTAGLKAIRIQSSGSKVDAFDGAVVYYRPAEGVPADAMGKLCVVETDDGTYLRVVRQGYARGKYNLAPVAGGKTETDATLRSAAPIAWLKM